MIILILALMMPIVVTKCHPRFQVVCTIHTIVNALNFLSNKKRAILELLVIKFQCKKYIKSYSNPKKHFYDQN